MRGSLSKGWRTPRACRPTSSRAISAARAASSWRRPGWRSQLSIRSTATVRRWFGVPGEDPLLVLQRVSGERPEAAEALAAFLDRSSLEPLHRYLRDSG